MNEIIISQCSAEGLQANSMSTGGIQGDVNPAVDGSAYEELICSPSSTGVHTGGRWRIVFFGTVNGTVSLLARRQAPILFVLLV